MNRFKDYLILTLGLLVLALFLMKCGGGDPTPKPEYIKGKEKIKWVVVTRPYKVIEFKTIKAPIADSMKPSGDTIPVIPIIRYYNDSIADSNVTIHTHIKTKGELQELGIAYRLKTPLYLEKTIERTDTLIRPNKINLYGGVAISGNNTSLDAKVYLNLSKGRKNVHVAYSPLSKTIEGGVGIILYRSKK